MAAQDITLDAHTLIWYIDKQSNKKLSKLALETIKTNSQGIVVIYLV